jgi:hypothetical protein
MSCCLKQQTVCNWQQQFFFFCSESMYHLFSQEDANGGAAKQQLFHLATTGALSLRQKPV